MTIQTINIGGYANDSTGDDLRTAFNKVNQNFALISNEVNIANGANIGVGIGLFAQRNAANLQFKSLVSRDNSVVITSTDTTVNIQSRSKLENDTSPKLSNDLNLNGHDIVNGNINATVSGVDVSALNSIISLFIASNMNQFSIDMGTIIAPTGYTVVNEQGFDLDMNGGTVDGFATHLDPAAENNYDFGSF